MFTCCRALLISGCTRLPMRITLQEGKIEKKRSKGAQEEKIPGAPTYFVVPASMAGMGITIEEDEQLPDVIF